MPLSKFAARHSRSSPGFQGTNPLLLLGGLNEDENRQALRKTDLKLAFNCARKGSMTGTRPAVAFGDSDYAAVISGTPAVQGIVEFIRNHDADRDLITVAGGDIRDAFDRSPVFDKSATTITSGADNQWTFTVFQDKLFAAGGADGDGFWYWDGTGGSPPAVAEVALSFDVKFVFSKWNLIFVAGMDGSTFDDNEMVVRYCDFATDATVAANWKSANVIPGQLLGENFGVGSRGSEFSTGIASFQDNAGDYVLMLTNKRIVAFTPNPQMTSNADIFRIANTVATGCVNQSAYVNLGLDVGDSVYMSRDGIHSMAQSEQFGDRVNQYLSWPIRKTWDTLNRSRLKFATGAYWPTEGLVLFSVSTGSNPTNDLILCLDIKDSGRLTPESVRWYKWELDGLEANMIVPVRGSDGKPYPYVAGTAGQVCRFQRETYGDLASDTLSVDFHTKDDDFGLPSREKHAGDTYILLQGSGDYSINHTLMLDDGSTQIQTSVLEVPNTGSVYDTGKYGTATYGDSESVVRHRVPGVGSSPTIGHRFSHSPSNEPFWVGMINQEVFISGPSDDSTANVTGG